MIATTIDGTHLALLIISIVILVLVLAPRFGR